LQEDEIKTVRGEEVKIKTIMLKDSTETAKITLWRDLATADTRPGDYRQGTDVVVNFYNNQATLQTTSRSNVKVSIL
jgi:ssDNA-binding replication factor A large subunit